MPLKCSMLDVAIVAVMVFVNFIAYRLTNHVLSHQEIGVDEIDAIDVIYEDWLSSMKDSGRSFDEHDPDELMLRLKKRLQVHRQIVKGTKSSTVHSQHNEGPSDAKDVRGTKRKTEV